METRRIGCPLHVSVLPASSLDRNTFCIRTIKFADSFRCIFRELVGNIGDAFRAASAVVCEGKLQDWSNSIEEILYYFLATLLF